MSFQSKIKKKSCIISLLTPFRKLKGIFQTPAPMKEKCWLQKVKKKKAACKVTDSLTETCIFLAQKKKRV